LTRFDKVETLGIVLSAMQNHFPNLRGAGGVSYWRCVFGFCLSSLMAGVPAEAGPSDDLTNSLAIIRAVGTEGRGNAEAAVAWKKVADSDASAIVPTLAAMDGANDFALNWLRPAIDTLADRAQKNGGALPLPDLGTFLLDTRHSPRARRLSLDLLAKADPGTADKLLAGMLNDPSLEIRSEAVQKVIALAETAATNNNKTGAELLYHQALTSARDIGQIDSVSKRLEELGQPVDLLTLFGFLTDWKVVGPFDNTDKKGFEGAYPPEQGIDLAATYDGKAKKVKWQNVTVTNKYGLIDLNQVCGKLKGVAAYGMADFYSDQAQPAEVRLGCATAWKVWLNGKLLFSRDEYHYDSSTEEHPLPVQLQPGRNIILVKVCQNETVEDWTVDWDFRLRVTDAIGTPIASRPPVKVAAASSQQ
jgi:hypothetical protein